jgi:hypothetical protein
MYFIYAYFWLHELDSYNDMTLALWKAENLFFEVFLVISLKPFLEKVHVFENKMYCRYKYTGQRLTVHI